MNSNIVTIIETNEIIKFIEDRSVGGMASVRAAGSRRRGLCPSYIEHY